MLVYVHNARLVAVGYVERKGPAERSNAEIMSVIRHRYRTPTCAAIMLLCPTFLRSLLLRSFICETILRPRRLSASLTRVPLDF